MATQKTKVPEDGGSTESSASEPLTLDEFCMRLSQNDRRVEMIGAFHSVEKKAQRHKDTEESYRARYDEFVNAPA